jgi:hypothetical protein
MTWAGKQGFQTAPAPDSFVVDSVGAPLGTAHAERGLAYYEVALSGHMVPQYAPWVRLPVCRLRGRCSRGAAERIPGDGVSAREAGHALSHETNDAATAGFRRRGHWARMDVGLGLQSDRAHEHLRIRPEGLQSIFPCTAMTFSRLVTATLRV